MDACWKEWKNLESREVWKSEDCVEWLEVSNAAIAKGEEAHVGILFGIIVEEGSEFLEGDPRRYFKYRVVFRGNDVKDQNWDVAVCQETATTPTTLEASRYSDLLICLLGNSVQGRDAQQAYLQAEIEGTPNYVVLPPELWMPMEFMPQATKRSRTSAVSPKR